MYKQLKKIYFILSAPAVVGFMAVYVFRQIHQTKALPEHLMASIAPTIFILSAVFAIAGPILYRSFFADRQRHFVKVPQRLLYKFERNQIGIAIVAPYLALIGYFLQLPHFHLTATLLMALYALYYYYPFEKRIALDEKIFRAGDMMSIDQVKS